MFLPLNHKNLEVYKISRELIKECYKTTHLLPAEERYNLTSQIRRASLSVKLNIAEGSSRRSEVERKRYFEISRGSVIEIDAAVEAIIDFGYINESQFQNLGKLLNSSFALLFNMMK